MLNPMCETLKSKHERGERILVAYFPLGDPAMGDPNARVGEFLEAGVDVLELGLPYEDPSLDGAVVSASMERSLSEMDLYQCLDVLHTLRSTYPSACLQIMAYFETVVGLGINKFCSLIKEAGADGAIVPNVPTDSYAALKTALNDLELLDILFAPIELTEKDARTVAKDGEGYVFLQAQNGGTGIKTSVAPQVKVNIATLRSLNTNALLCAGFGISSPEQVRTLVGMGVDGVIVGSSVILSVLEGRSKAYLQSLKEALK